MKYKLGWALWILGWMFLVINISIEGGHILAMLGLVIILSSIILLIEHWSSQE